MAEPRIVRSARDGVARAVTRAPRKGMWTKERRAQFLDELAMSANVAASARRVGMAESTAYYLRRSNAEFREQWDEALAEGYVKLELTMLERAIKGVARSTVTAGGTTTRTRDYSDRLALGLLANHAKAVNERRARMGVPSGAAAGARDAVAELIETFDLMGERLAATDGDADGDGD